MPRDSSFMPWSRARDENLRLREAVDAFADVIETEGWGDADPDTPRGRAVISVARVWPSNRGRPPVDPHGRPPGGGPPGGTPPGNPGGGKP